MIPCLIAAISAKQPPPTHVDKHVTSQKCHSLRSHPGEAASSSELPDHTASEYNLSEDIFNEIESEILIK